MFKEMIHICLWCQYSFTVYSTATLKHIHHLGEMPTSAYMQTLDGSQFARGQPKDLSILTNFSYEDIQYPPSVGRDAEAARRKFIYVTTNKTRSGHISKMCGYCRLCARQWSVMIKICERFLLVALTESFLFSSFSSLCINKLFYRLCPCQFSRDVHSIRAKVVFQCVHDQQCC